MNMYLRELRINFKSLIIWLIVLIAFGIMVMAIYPTIAKEAETLEALMAALPKGMVDAFGYDKVSMTNIMGYYATEHLMWVSLLGSIYAMMLGAGMLSKEENDRTIEFLLSKPVNRSEIVTAKLLSTITLVFILNLIISLVMYITLQAVKIDDFSTKTFIILSISVLLLNLIYAFIGFLISVVFSRTKSVMPLTIGVVLVTYFLSIAAALNQKLDFLKYFSPFKYVDPMDIIASGRLDTDYLPLMAVISLAAIVFTYILYNRRNITA